MEKSCLLCGVGGQGTVLASKLIAYSAMNKGMKVRTAETIGMAQRGGSVVSHVRISDNEIASPLIPMGGADMLIGFEPGEVVRCLPYLKRDGVVVVNTKAVKPVTATLGGSNYDGEEMISYLQKKGLKVVVVDAEKICEECGSMKVLNIALLGIAAKEGALGITVDELKNAITNRVPEKFHTLNFKAIDVACNYEK